MNCYGIDAIYLWPRFVPVLSKTGYSPFVEREKEGVDLFLNLAFLIGFLSLESIIFRLIFHDTFFTWSMLVCGISSYLFYRAAVNAAHSWGESIKTAFDLYRYQLADQLALAPFKDREDEVSRWQRLSQFIQSGESWREFGEYAYLLPDSRHLVPSSDE